ncbi:MAG TPA: ketopantoate reductase C-terminal domain-containing protein, partial [Acetobacteraceae bacterium]|nr:ketopantoate reductase C-terminal domain-containing protein [Acetobacteraceae bacterium]
RITPRVEEVAALLALSDGCKMTTNLWGERWSKLVANGMQNGISAATGLIARDILLDDALRAFTARLGSEAIRVGQALGYALETILHMEPEIIARAGEGDEAARAAFDEKRLAEARKPGGGAHRPSMGQDMVKGRRTEIAFINGLVADRGAELGIPTPANAALTRIVQEVERGLNAPSPDLIKALRLN